MEISLESVLKYEQPTKYIVTSENYSDTFSIPVLTAGKSFVLGYTDEKDGICRASENPVIIFDDFTADCKYVDFDFKVKSSAMKILHKANENDNLRYYFYAMQAIDYTPFSHKRVWISEYSKFKIKNRAFTEQNKITAYLDNVVNAINIANERLNVVDELVISRFIDMFGDPIENEKRWDTIPLDDACISIVDCPHSTPHYTYENTGYMCIRTSIVKKNQILWDEIEYIPENEYLQRTKRRKPQKGDVVYTREGAILGIAAVIDRDCNVALGQRSMLLSPDTSICLPEFLSAAMNFDSFLNKVLERVSGSASPHINVGDIRMYNIIMPPLELQQQFADFLKLTDKSKHIVQKQIDDLQELLDSKMDEYFG